VAKRHGGVALRDAPAGASPRIDDAARIVLQLAVMSRPRTFAISGDECVAALRRLGFDVRRLERGRTILHRSGHLVVVPDELALTPSVLDGLLDEVDLSYESFLRLLEEAETEPELAALDALSS